MTFDDYRRALGPDAVGLTATPAVIANLNRARSRGWTVRELAKYTLAEWPSNVRSPAAMIRTRLAALSEFDPPGSTPTPPRYVSPYGRTGSPMPPDVREWLERQRWHK